MSRKLFIDSSPLSVMSGLAFHENRRTGTFYRAGLAGRDYVWLQRLLFTKLRNAKMNYQVTRIYSDAQGESHFEDILIPLNDNGPIGWLSDPGSAKQVIFRKVAENYDYDFHNAPARQYIALMDGEIEIETSLGEKRRFLPGDVLLVEDTTGKGHRSRNLRKAVRSSIFITL